MTKVFRSNDYNPFLWVCKQFFDRVEATKPPSSRNVSAEIFVVCRGFKAPKRIDPRLLDPQAVFAELSGPSIDHEAKVFKPEMKKRKREGYEEGDWTQFKEAPASEFIQSIDPIRMLATLNKLSFEQKSNGDIAQATLDRLPETTDEIRHSCADLKVLGRKDFKNLLKWRLRVRQIFGFSTKGKKVEPINAEEVAEVQSMDEDMQMQEEMQRLRDQQDSQKRKERRKENERKRKEILRMQMHMIAPTDIGLEQNGPLGEDSVFSMRTAVKAQHALSFRAGKMHSAVEQSKEESGEKESSGFSDSDSGADALEESLDAMYSQYQERKASSDAKHMAKRRRERADEWNGFDDNDGSDGETELMEDSASDGSLSDIDGVDAKALFGEPDEEEKLENRLSRRANIFFDNEIFNEIVVHAPAQERTEDADDSGIELDDANHDSEIKPASQIKPKSEPSNEVVGQTQQRAKKSESTLAKSKRESKSKDGLEYVRPEAEDSADSGERQNGRPNIDIITAEAMTLAHSLVTGRKSKEDFVDEGFNKYTFRDSDGLPEWFLEDENKHSKPLRPISAAAAAAVREKMRALNARPIKKVREAKERKRFKAARTLEKLKKKSAVLADDEGTSEKDKAQGIAKLMNKATKKQPRKKVKVVVAKGVNRGQKGRPRGTKGKYKMVDSRMKKDVRAMKRVAGKK